MVDLLEMVTVHRDGFFSFLTHTNQVKPNVYLLSIIIHLLEFCKERLISSVKFYVRKHFFSRP